MAKPKKVKKGEDLVNISRNQAVMDAGDLADAIAAMRGKPEPEPVPMVWVRGAQVPRVNRYASGTFA